MNTNICLYFANDIGDNLPAVSELLGGRVRKPGWYDAFIWLAFTALGFLAPLAVGIFVRVASGSGVTLESITGGGQFAVSSAGLLMTTSYFLARPSSISRLPLTEWFLLSSIVGLFGGIALFVTTTLSSSGIEIDARYYQWPSVGLFLCALAVAFVAVGLDRERDIEDPSFLERRKKMDLEEIEDNFNSTF